MTRTTTQAIALAIGVSLASYGPARADSIPLADLDILALGHPSTGHASNPSEVTGWPVTTRAVTGETIACSGANNSSAILAVDLYLLGGPDRSHDARLPIRTDVRLILGASSNIGSGGPIAGSQADFSAGVDTALTLNDLGSNLWVQGDAGLLSGDLGVDLRLSLSHDRGRPAHCLPYPCDPCVPPTDPSGGPVNAAPAPPGYMLAAFGMGCILLGRIRRFLPCGPRSAATQN